MASRTHFIDLAKRLPPILQRFLARYPPAAIFPEGVAPTPTAYQEDRSGTSPFRFWKHPDTGKWHDPIYSLRRQADLIKLAREHGIEELLPHSNKGIEFRVAKRVQEGLRVRGTGRGQRVKGHIHERFAFKKMQARRKAMLGMPQLVARWRITGRRRWRRFPKRLSPMSR